MGGPGVHAAWCFAMGALAGVGDLRNTRFHGSRASTSRQGNPPLYTWVLYPGDSICLKVLVPIPYITILVTIYVVMLSITTFTMWDLQFQSGPIIVFVIIAALVAVAYCTNNEFRRIRFEAARLHQVEQTMERSKFVKPVAKAKHCKKRTKQKRATKDNQTFVTRPIEVYLPRRADSGGVFHLPTYRDDCNDDYKEDFFHNP